MVSDCIGQITIDNKYALIQIHPTYSIAIVPYINEPHPTLELVVFYANCLAYEHEIPVSVYPKNRKALIEPIIKGKKGYQQYNDTLCQAYEMLNSIRFGLGNVVFRYEAFDKELDISYSIRYQEVEKEISIYATALRQLDPLSEYLNYYRIIESVSNNNGKGWIDSNINRMKNYDFGFLQFGGWNMACEKRRKNLYSIYRNKALSRLKKLENIYPQDTISSYLYNDNRCGIAHGKANVKQFDFNYNVIEISQDNYILKLLSRIAIEDKITQQ